MFKKKASGGLLSSLMGVSSKNSEPRGSSPLRNEFPKPNELTTSTPATGSANAPASTSNNGNGAAPTHGANTNATTETNAAANASSYVAASNTGSVTNPVTAATKLPTNAEKEQPLNTTKIEHKPLVAQSTVAQPMKAVGLTAKPENKGTVFGATDFKHAISEETNEADEDLAKRVADATNFRGLGARIGTQDADISGSAGQIYTSFVNSNAAQGINLSKALDSSSKGSGELAHRRIEFSTEGLASAKYATSENIAESGFGDGSSLGLNYNAGHHNGGKAVLRTTTINRYATEKIAVTPFALKRTETEAELTPIPWSSTKSSLAPEKKDKDRESKKSSSSDISKVNDQLGGTGLLTVFIGEAKNLTLPNGSKVILDNGLNIEHAKLPYAVIDFDKNESLVRPKEVSKTESLFYNHKANFDVSRETQITITLFWKLHSVDILLGSCKIKPHLNDPAGSVYQWYTLYSGMGTVSGEIGISYSFKKSENKKGLSIDDFELLKVIGKGSFGKVMQVRKKDTNRIYAMKILKKSHIVEREEISHTLAERAVLSKINHPFIVPLKFSFQTADKLYLVLAFVNGGELFFHLQNEGRFTEERSRFYIAELVSALEQLHNYNIVYRDLKPENILLDSLGHIALCDFGLCKLNMQDGNKTNTFCGTPEYLAPELIIGKGYTKVVDWWTIGILLYEMIVGLPPFYDENLKAMYKKILVQPLEIPEDVSPDAADLLRKLLVRDPNERLGANGADEIKSHPFFYEINWGRLLARKYAPPYKPAVESAFDTSNFDEEFTSEIPSDSLSDGDVLSQTIQNQFAGFSYQANDAFNPGLQGGGGSIVAQSRMNPATNASYRNPGLMHNRRG